MPAPRLQAQPPVSTCRRKTRWIVALVAVLTVVALLWYPVYEHLCATAVLLRIQSSEAHAFFADRGMHPLKTQESTFASDGRQLRTRLYIPTDIARVPAMVVIPGVHHLGYNEPRLVRLAKAFAGSGMVVATPELPELADYEIKPVSIQDIAAAADDLAARMNTPCVGVLGVSFAGGLALSAASQPETSRHICYVMALGAHEDLARVMRFFATDQAVYPDGHVLAMPSHEYGALVAIYGHPEEYFPAADSALAREAIRQQLFEDLPKAREAAKKLSPSGQATMAMLLSPDHGPAKKVLLANLEKHRAEMDAVSPGPELYRIHVPVLLLHGAGDNVVPPSETAWLAKDLPPRELRAVLVSPAISHAELDRPATLFDKFRIVHFIVELLAAAKDGPYNSIDLQRVGGG